MINLSPSMQKYLLVIFELSQKTKHIKQIDVAVQLGYSKASVFRAIHFLKNNGYLTIQNNYILLTETGYQQAFQLYTNYQVLYQLLLKHELSIQEAKFYSLQMIFSIDDYFLKKMNDYHQRHHISIT